MDNRRQGKDIAKNDGKGLDGERRRANDGWGGKKMSDESRLLTDAELAAIAERLIAIPGVSVRYDVERLFADNRHLREWCQRLNEQLSEYLGEDATVNANVSEQPTGEIAFRGLTFNGEHFLLRADLFVWLARTGELPGLTDDQRVLIDALIRELRGMIHVDKAWEGL